MSSWAILKQTKAFWSEYVHASSKLKQGALSGPHLLKCWLIEWDSTIVLHSIAHLPPLSVSVGGPRGWNDIHGFLGVRNCILDSEKVRTSKHNVASHHSNKLVKPPPGSES